MNFIRPVIKIEDMMFMTGVFLKLCSALSGPIQKNQNFKEWARDAMATKSHYGISCGWTHYIMKRVELWCREGDSNPHGLLHTPLKRKRLPVPPSRHISRGQLLFYFITDFLQRQIPGDMSHFSFFTEITTTHLLKRETLSLSTGSDTFIL